MSTQVGLKAVLKFRLSQIRGPVYVEILVWAAPLTSLFENKKANLLFSKRIDRIFKWPYGKYTKYI